MSDERYQGWANRETWLVNLWLNNEQGLQEMAQAACNVDGEMLYEAATSLEHFVDDLVGGEYGGLVPTGFHLDLLNAALARVHWLSIAAAFRVEASDQ